MPIDLDFHVNEFIGFIGVIVAGWLLNESVKHRKEPCCAVRMSNKSTTSEKIPQWKSLPSPIFRFCFLVLQRFFPDTLVKQILLSCVNRVAAKHHEANQLIEVVPFSEF